MFSKFDVQLSSDEVTPVEPMQADWEEYHAWLEEQEAGEPDPSPEDWNAFDGHLDFYADCEEAYDNACDQGHDWDDYDEADLYGAECENFAVREWD
jgi:hypothetical protein